MKHVMKQIHIQSHEHGEDCFCKRLQCFKNVRGIERQRLLRHFNQLQTVNEQNNFLASMITENLVMHRSLQVWSLKTKEVNMKIGPKK